MAPAKTEGTNNPPAKRQYHALTRSPEELAEILSNIQENLAGETITPRDLQKITVPSQGVTKWIIPNAETGKKDALDEIEGIIVYVGSPRAYWSTPLEMANRTPPDCSSTDGHVGVGNPGGNCVSCPFNQWGSAKTGSRKGKACKEQRLIYMIRPDDFLPTVLQAPVTSIEQLRKHMMRLATMTKPKSYNYKKVYTKMTLNEVTSSDFPYSEIIFEMADPVEEEYLPRLGAVHRINHSHRQPVPHLRDRTHRGADGDRGRGTGRSPGNQRCGTRPGGRSRRASGGRRNQRH